MFTTLLTSEIPGDGMHEGDKCVVQLQARYPSVYSRDCRDCKRSRCQARAGHNGVINKSHIKPCPVPETGKGHILTLNLQWARRRTLTMEIQLVERRGRDNRDILSFISAECITIQYTTIHVATS